MKRDLKLNMEELTDVEAKIGRYIGDLDQIESASSAFLQKLKKQDSVSYDSLSNIWESGIMEAEGQLHERLELLKKLMSDYVDEMEGLIFPVSRGDMMRVDRNDIWWNLKQIENDLSGLSDICYSIPSSYANYRYCVMDYWLGDDEELRAKEKAEQRRRERNYRKLSNFQDSIKTGMIPQMEERMDDLWKIYNDSIVPFENTDDDYHDRAASYYDMWADIGDHLTDFGRGLWDFGRGIWDAAVDLVDGIATLALWISPQARIMQLFGMLPEEMDEKIKGMDAGIVQLFKDPVNTLGAMGQGIADTVDEEGPVYAFSYVLTDVLIEIALEKGLGKVMEAGNKLDDVAKHADDVAKYADDIPANQLDELEDLRKIKDEGITVGEGGLRSSFANNIDDILAKQGLSLEEFNSLRLKDVSTLTDAEKATLKVIRESVPMPDADTLMQKVIPASDIEKYMNGSYTQVGGYVTRAEDVLQLNTYDELYESLRLDYPGSVYKPMADDSIGVIRYTTDDASKISIPYSKEMGGTVAEAPPFTGNGFTKATNGEIIPEFKCDGYLDVSDGAQLVEISKDGTETIKAIYSETKGKFVPVE